MEGSGRSFHLLAAPLLLALILTILFYMKSIKLLREEMDCAVSSTSRYIGNFKLYSFTQLLTFSPLVIYLLLIEYLRDSEEDDSTACFWTYVSEICQGITSLSGFANSMIFLSKGIVRYEERSTSDMGLYLSDNSV